MAGLATPTAVRDEMALLLAETRAASYDDDEFDEHEIADAVADAVPTPMEMRRWGPQGELTPLRRATSSPPRPVNANSPTSRSPFEGGSRRPARISAVRSSVTASESPSPPPLFPTAPPPPPPPPPPLCSPPPGCPPSRHRRRVRRGRHLLWADRWCRHCPTRRRHRPAAPVVSRHRRVGPLLTATPTVAPAPSSALYHHPVGLHVARTGGKPRCAACGGGGVGGASRVGAPEAARDAGSRSVRTPGAPRAPRGRGSVGVVASPLELLASAPSEWGEDAVPNPRAVPDLRATSSGEGGTERDGGARRPSKRNLARPAAAHPQWRPLVPLPDRHPGVGGASPGFASGPPPPVTARTDRVGWRTG